ncbi:hypothetical protein, partial [Alkalihalobacillus alcalophilus]
DESKPQKESKSHQTKSTYQKKEPYSSYGSFHIHIHKKVSLFRHVPMIYRNLSNSSTETSKITE